MSNIALTPSTDRPVYDSQAPNSAFVEEFVALIRYRDLVYQLIARSIKTRYKRSVLGVAWTMVNPLLTMLVLTVVFSAVFKFAAGQYALFVLSGLLIWNFFAQSTMAAMNDLVWSGGLVSRIYLPKSAFSVAAIGTGLVNLALAMVPYVLISFGLGEGMHWTWLLLPIPALSMALLALGVGLTLSSAAVFFPDIMPTYEILLLAWMYLTPVIYPFQALPSSIQPWLKLNPLYYPLTSFRALLLEGRVPPAGDLVLGLAVGGAAAGLGWWLFSLRSKEIAYRV